MAILCEQCRRAFAGQARAFAPEPTGRYYVLHSSFASFNQAIRGRCRLCSELWDDAEKFEEKLGWSRSSLSSGMILLFVVMSIPQADRTEVIIWQYDFYIPSSVAPNCFWKPFISPKRDNSAEPKKYEVNGQTLQFLSCRPFTLTPHVGFEDTRTLEQIGTSAKLVPTRTLTKKWLQECRDNHPECKPWRDFRGDRTPPTRLLYVGPPGTPRIHLREMRLSKEDPEEEQYATLSHCWGNIEHPILTKDTVDRLRQGIEPKTLPKTFRNAVAVTRQLGLQYLWIDSLCIFQDSEEDWRAEGTKMGNIYAYGAVNIAATMADNSDGGLFFDRDPVLVQPLQVSISWPMYGSQDTPAMAPGRTCLYNIAPKGLWSECVDAACLNKRAWVMQERFLSPRILHFGKQQLFWECKTKKASEMFPEGLVTPLERGLLGRAIKLLDKIGQQSSWLVYPSSHPRVAQHGRWEFVPPTNKELVKEAYMSWLSLVQQYSACAITRDSDTLIAFSGLAKRYTDFLGSGCIAGILGGDLHLQLLWYTSDASAVRLGTWHNHATWRAPAFSWASVRGRVEWDLDRLPVISAAQEDRDGTFLEYIDHHAEPIGSDKHGGLKAAWLKVKGNITVLSGHLDWKPDSSFIQTWGPFAKVVWLKIKDKSFQAIAQFDDQAIIDMLSQSLTKGTANGIFSMPVLSTTRDAYDADGRFKERTLRVQGLLLHIFGMDLSQPGGLSRIGRFTLTSNFEDGKVILDYFMQLYDTARTEIILL